MKLIFSLFLIIICFACSTKKEQDSYNKNLKSEETSIRTEVAIPPLLNTITLQEDKQKINLDSLIKNADNEYLACLHNDTLSLCSYRFFNITDYINYSNFKDSIEVYYPFESEKKEVIRVYSSDSSIVKTFHYDKGNKEYFSIVYGRIYSNLLLKNVAVKIGMQKQQFLELFFEKSELLDQIQNMIIYEDAMGEAYTEYRFRNNILEGIYFESDNEWVKRE